MKFGEKLMTLRKQNVMSQEELAEKLDVTRQTISKWELDQTTPDMDKLKEIAKIFQVTVDELINENENSDVKIEHNDQIENVNYSEAINSKSENGDKKIAMVIVIVIAICVVIFLLVPMIFTVFIGKKIVKSTSEIIENPEKYVNEMIDTTGEIYNTINESGIIDDMASKSSNMLGGYEVSSRNSSFESLWNGLIDGGFIKSGLNQVITINSKDDVKITVKYGDNETQDTKEIANISNKLDDLKKYLVTYEYDENGLINKMIIENM